MRYGVRAYAEFAEGKPAKTPLREKRAKRHEEGELIAVPFRVHEDETANVHVLINDA